MVERRTAGMLRFTPAVLALAVAAPAAEAQQRAPAPPPAKDVMTFQLVTNDPDAPPERQHRWVTASGGFVPDTGKAFETFLKTTPIDANTTIYFDSKGGSILGALRLGEQLRKINATVSVGRSMPVGGAIQPGVGGAPSLPRHQLIPRLGRCFSACTYAFLGGVRRTIPVGAAYGVHMFWPSEKLEGLLQRPYDYREIERAQRLTAQIAVYIQRMGGDVALLELASRTPPKNAIRNLTTKEIVDLKVATITDGIPVFAAPGSWGQAGVGVNATLSTGGLATLNERQDVRYVLELGCSGTRGFVTVRFEQTPATAPPAGARLSLKRILLASGVKNVVVANSEKDVLPRPAAFPTVSTDKPGVWIGRRATVLNEVFENAVANPREGLTLKLEDGEGKTSEIRLPPGNLPGIYRRWTTGCNAPPVPDTSEIAE